MKTLKTIIPVMVLAILVSCTEKIEFPDPEAPCITDFTDHPGDAVYQSVLNDYVDKGLPGISVLISTPDDGLWVGTAGYANIEEQVEMTPCNLQFYASIPKTYTAVIILQLLEEGKLELDSRLAEFIDAEKYGYIPNFDKITVRHLLQHTSGLPDIIDIEFLTAFFNDPSLDYTSDDFLEFLRGKEALWEPGTKFKYSDGNYTLLSYIIDELDGNHIESFRDRIFDPLGLTNTFYHNGSYPYFDGTSSGYWDEFSDGTIENVSDWQIHITSMLLASDGIIGDIFDLEVFIRSMYNRTLLDESTLEIVSEHWTDARDSDMGSVIDSYGLGLMRFDNEYGTWVGHMGNHIGSAAWVFYSPEKDITLIAMTNMGTFFSFKYKQMIFNDLREDLMRAVFGEGN